jgi:hypothetical protein
MNSSLRLKRLLAGEGEKDEVESRHAGSYVGPPAPNMAAGEGQPLQVTWTVGDGRTICKANASASGRYFGRVERTMTAGTWGHPVGESGGGEQRGGQCTWWGNLTSRRLQMRSGWLIGPKFRRVVCCPWPWHPPRPGPTANDDAGVPSIR